MRPEYARRLAGWLGMEPEPALRAVADAVRSGRPAATSLTRHEMGESALRSVLVGSRVASNVAPAAPIGVLAGR